MIMLVPLLSVALAVLGALANATSSVLQRKADRDEPEDRSGLAMMWDLAHKPTWVGGILAIIAGFLLQAGALATGPIALVQPILVLELPLTLLLAGLVFRSRLHPREWTAVAGMGAGLGLMLFALQPSGGSPQAASAIRWIAGVVTVLAVAGLFVRLGYRVHHTRRAAYLGIATGIGFGFTATLIAGITAAYATTGIGGVFTTWQTYLLIVLGPAFFFLLQKTMQAGRLVASQPALTLADPVVAAAFGLAVFGEHVRTGGWLTAALLGAALVAAGTLLLVRSPLLRDSSDERQDGKRQVSERQAGKPAPVSRDHCSWRGMGVPLTGRDVTRDRGRR